MIVSDGLIAHKDSATWKSRWLIICYAIYNLLSGIAAFNLALWLYFETDSPFYMTLALFVNMAGRIYPGFILGKIIDHLEKANVLKFATISIMLTYFISVCFFTFESKAEPFVMLLEFAFGVTSLFYELTILSSVSAFLPKEKYQQVYGFMELLIGISATLTPIFGALSHSYFKMHNVMLAALFSALPLVVLTFLIRLPQSLRKPTLEIRFSTLHFIKDNKILLALLTHFSLFNFFNGLAIGIINIYVLRTFNGSTEHLAFVNLFVAVGMLAGGMLSSRNIRINPIFLVALGGVIAALYGRIILGLCPSIIVFCLAMLIRMGMIPIINTSNQVIWSNLTPEEVRGKVFGMRKMIALGGYPLAMIIGGMLYSLCENYLYSPGAFFVITGVLEILACVFLLYHKSAYNYLGNNEITQ
jgi:DHA3 family macrolide efflux protein-like MFS transporter